MSFSGLTHAHVVPVVAPVFLPDLLRAPVLPLLSTETGEHARLAADQPFPQHLEVHVAEVLLPL